MNDAHPLNALPQGHRLQEYELVRVLGFGGFGMTYLGYDHNLDKAVAIKEYLPSDIATRTGDNSVAPQASQFRDDFEWGLDRFLDEARTLARFDHRHIIKVHRYFQAHGTAYIVMEYAEGETLSSFLQSRGTLSEAELKAILYPILDGLEVVHGADFLHRDIKPGNIVIRDEDNSPVLLDFGAARQAIGSRSRSVTSIITPGYAPIEQYERSGHQGPWTDIYALGAVCYQALTGQVPNDATERMRRDSLPPVSEYCVGQASAGFLSAIDSALQLNEEDRPQSIADWRVMLKDEEPPPPPPPPPPPEEEDRQKPKGKVFATIACVLAVLIGGVYYYQYEYVPNQRRQAEETAKAETTRALEEQISGLLSAASDDLSRDRLTSPAGANAWEKYQAVLALEPGHKIASAGLDRIIDRYVSKFDASLQRKDFDEAEGYVSRIQSVHADAPMLSELADRLSVAQEADRQRREAEAARRRQAAAATEQRVGRRFKDCADCPEMVVVPSGSFTMGSPSDKGADDERPQHVVHIDYRFAVGVYEVTFSEWDACVNLGGCGGYIPYDRGWGRGNRPVMNVSWDDAKSYVRWLSQKTGHRYGLLSESEWEYVARAGTTTVYSWGDNIGGNRANCDGCGSRWDDDRTAPVGSFSANGWGVHDMHGNVWEWVEDCYNASYEGAPTDGTAWASGDCGRRVLRGGSWNSFRGSCVLRIASGIPPAPVLTYGFRIVRRF